MDNAKAQRSRREEQDHHAGVPVPLEGGVFVGRVGWDKMAEEGRLK
jgi:hypothetical protein